MRKSVLEILLTQHLPGTWVILDPQMSKVLGAAKTLEGAMKKAGVPKVGKASQKRPVAMQVQDPSMKFF